MDKRMLEFTVGLFIALGVAALLMLAFRVSNINSVAGNGESYTLVANFDNIGGLKVRSPVKLGGVLVGRVSEIVLDEHMTPQVRLAIDARYDKFPSETSAAIQTAGLLGEQFISLTLGGDETILKDGGRIRDTQSAIVLEELIGKFLFNNESKNDL